MTDRDAILARRRRLIALALAGAAVTNPGCAPQVCLTIIDASVPDVPDAPSDGGVDMPPDASDEATKDVGSADGGG